MRSSFRGVVEQYGGDTMLQQGASPYAEQVFVTTDLETMSDLVREQYSSMRLSTSGERHLMRIAQRQLSRSRLGRTTVLMDLDVTSEPLGALCIGRVLDGRVGFQLGAEEHSHVAGDVYLCAPHDAGFVGLIRDLDAEFAFLGPALLGEIAQPAPGESGPVRLLDFYPVSTSAAAQWWRIYSFVQATVKSLPPGPRWPLVAAELDRLLAATALATFPNNALVDPTIEDRHDAHPLALRRAMAFIDANPAHDISTTSIAAAADVTVRTLQLAFRRHLDTTPMAYLRRVRLHHAYDQLRTASPGSTTVANVAAQWGFFNFGRFAGRYRAEFGELPSQTLNR